VDLHDERPPVERRPHVLSSLGVDTANFAFSAVAVNADVSAGVAAGEGSDTLASVENLTGSTTTTC
jgi:hypothetical protein